MLISRAIKPDALHEFQTLHHAILSYDERPSPSFNRNNKIKEEWFSKTDVERKVELFFQWIHLEMHLHFVVTIPYILDVIMSCTLHILFNDNTVKVKVKK